MPRWCWIAGYIVASVIFGAGLFQWIQADAYIPAMPEPGTASHYAFLNPVTVRPLARYKRLADGELFFEKLPEPVIVKVNSFHSNLKIFGIIHGQNPRAVVGLDGNDSQTWVAKPGMVIGGEKIVKIGRDFIMVQNESGEGKVAK